MQPSSKHRNNASASARMSARTSRCILLRSGNHLKSATMYVHYQNSKLLRNPSCRLGGRFFDHTAECLCFVRENAFDRRIIVGMEFNKWMNSITRGQCAAKLPRLKVYTLCVAVLLLAALNVPVSRAWNAFLRAGKRNGREVL